MNAPTKPKENFMYIEANSIRLRENLRSYLDHMLSTGDRVLITRHGKPVAALVSPKDLNALEKVENNREIFMQNRHDAKMREFRAMKEVLDGEG
ncbi:type II toxin-antitoxin system Phd/YefM family antitoxin [uncultured Roseovarius sp.]|uniref:type II toxin-antitoxin system Phd/YefM family antitoxin n=1 Tax=uncultured Roseovarius sp. TaxID=293344 RepID=UPI00262C7A9C|nr:type II toxin-antitoxin system Phd/YefM family antitoxin [uncultured Roseovarius sp.]